jgi:tRNA G18 (ribose-2'-O)-methylase SpoU
VPVHFVTDPADPRLDEYRDLKDRHLSEDGDRFIAESEMVVRRLLASGLPISSLLLTAPRLSALEDLIAGDTPVYVVPQPVMDRIAGFPVHRGCLAVGRRPATARIPDDARRVLVLEDLVDVDNVGSLVRNGAALGADALLLSPRCADPYYRKAIRVSAGAVFSLPIVRARRWPQELAELRSERGLTVIGAVLDADAIPLAKLPVPSRWALVVGAEGPGLTPGTKQLCDHKVTIPMARTDSLNVATAAAIVLYQLVTPCLRSQST